MVFIYLLKRNKKGVQIITLLNGSCPTKRITNIKELSLGSLEKKVEDVIYENRMAWEPWMEEAETIDKLFQALAARGVSNLPMQRKPIIKLSETDPRTLDEIVTKRLKN